MRANFQLQYKDFVYDIFIILVHLIYNDIKN